MLDDPHHRREDLRLLQQAIRNNWKIPEKVFEAFPAEVIKLAADTSLRPRERLRAMEVMLRMHAQNEGATLNVVQPAAISQDDGADAARREMLADEHYHDYIRTELLGQDRHAGNLGDACQSGAVEDGSAPDGNRPPDNGNGRSANGNGQGPRK
jgi:hypothetical protein